jgi:hypothetical protein
MNVISNRYVSRLTYSTSFFLFSTPYDKKLMILRIPHGRHEKRANSSCGVRPLVLGPPTRLLRRSYE